jgi:hypothetical protein
MIVLSYFEETWGTAAGGIMSTSKKFHPAQRFVAKGPAGAYLPGIAYRHILETTK